MISITELWSGQKDRNHELRYNKPRTVNEVRPVVVWNSTRRCNLKCAHCYSDSHNTHYSNELSFDEAKAVIDDLAAFKSPCLLFSGGEPLLRENIMDLLEYARDRDLPTALSTNGTLIDKKMARTLKDANLRYVGISLDGIGDINDTFRGVVGAFERAKNAFLDLREFDVRCGLRLTLTKHNLESLPQIFQFVEENEIDRVCFYHLVPVGRGAGIKDMVPAHSDVRIALDKIVQWVERLAANDQKIEVLTVDNHADNIYLYLKIFSGNPEKIFNGDQERILSLIRANGGACFSSGVGIACIDQDGFVHPDQFWRDLNLGNVKERPFSVLWTDERNVELSKLRDRIPHIKGRCARCKWLELCGGGLRSRAYAWTGDPWESDPGCYLSDEETKFSEAVS